MLPMILPQLSQREDILLALVVLASGIILLLQGRYVSESVQFLLILLLLPTLCYTIEIIWLRKRIKR
ncbi:MAG: Ycf66 family protein, partial [Oscillatoria sp. PMC 1076.18]|nr:Ycf66 family protein [Oscillatoria sp. PMC 1076.18]